MLPNFFVYLCGCSTDQSMKRVKENSSSDQLWVMRLLIYPWYVFKNDTAKNQERQTQKSFIQTKVPVGRDPQRSPSATPGPAQHHLQEPHHVPESIVQTLLELCHAWGCEHFPGEPVPVPNHPLSEEPFRNVQPKPPLTQLQTIPSGPVTDHHREEISVCPSTSPHKEAVDCDEVSPQSPLFQAEQTSSSSYGFPSRPVTILISLLWTPPLRKCVETNILDSSVFLGYHNFPGKIVLLSL
ncbi:uncharacterized protein ACIQIH_013099 isoform 1-T2 [Cyanocitta cristata]